MRNVFFVTGTDTGVGKTVISTGLLAAARAQGLETAAVKPVAAGCELTASGLRNDDALALQAAMTRELAYEQINPVALAEPLSPHIAAARAGRRLNVATLAGYCRGALTPTPQFGLVEGAGGWRVPISDRETLADLARELALPVILVVGLRLGCINHTLLTAESIARDGLPLAGWVGNSLESGMDAQQDNLHTLRARLPAPCLGVVPWLKASESNTVPQAGSSESQALANPHPTQLLPYLDLSPLQAWLNH